MPDRETDERALRDEKLLRALVKNGYILSDPSFNMEGLFEALLLTAVDHADRLAALETTLEHALDAAYVNYDPVVAQLSEVRREIGRMQTNRSTELADRDRLWCEALLSVKHDGLEYAQAVLAKFNELRP